MDSKLDKPIHVSVLSMWYIHEFVGSLLTVNSLLYSQLNICLKNTRRHFSDNRHLHTLKCVYWWKL